MQRIAPWRSSAHRGPRVASGGLSLPWPWIVGAVVAGGFLVLLLAGLPYYQLGPAARRASTLHSSLRPSGSTGHLYGWLGTAVILSNLLYLVRRRLAFVERLGSMKGWLRWHVMSGIVGSLLVVLHSALTLRTAVAIVSSLSLAVVVVTGLVGRYIWALVPRAADGSGRSQDEVRADLDRALMRLRGLGADGRRVADEVEAEAERVLAPFATRSRGGLAAVIAAVRARLRLRALPTMAKRAFAATPAARSQGEALLVIEAVRQIALLELRSDARWAVDAAASSWRGLHRVFAFLMAVAAALHVTVAIYLGYGP